MDSLCLATNILATINASNKMKYKCKPPGHELLTIAKFCVLSHSMKFKCVIIAHLISWLYKSLESGNGTKISNKKQRSVKSKYLEQKIIKEYPKKYQNNA